MKPFSLLMQLQLLVMGVVIMRILVESINKAVVALLEAPGMRMLMVRLPSGVFIF